MTQSAKAQEPSMEEILASIRRIIADDDATKTRAVEPAPPKHAMAASAPVPSRTAPASPRPPTASRPAPPLPPPAPDPVMGHDEIEDMVAGLDAPTGHGGGEPDILDLTESMTTGNGATPPNFRTIDGEPDVVFADDPTGHAEDPAAHKGREEPRRAGGDRPLLSASTSAAIDSAFNTLAHTVLVQNSRTLEDLVREMLRPLLKSWLDDNLPGLVERIVKAEIERVSRGHS
jgi:uncharacterized protein